MIDKRVETLAAALAGLGDGARVMVSGFAGAGFPTTLVRTLEAAAAADLTLIVNSLRIVETHAPRLFRDRRVTRAICSGARSRGAGTACFERNWAAGELELELVPQGSFVERIRAGGAGISAFFTPTGTDTRLAEGKEVREFDGKPCVLEHSIRADFALIRGHRADRWGNVAFKGSQMNFAPAMASAAETTVVEVDRIDTEPLDPHRVDIAGIYVQRVIQAPDGR